MAWAQKQNRGLIVANVVVAALLAVALAVFATLLLADDDKKGEKNTGKPSRSASPSTTPARSIENRRVDSRPLTEDEVFGEQTFEVNDRTYRVMKKETLSSCLNATYGVPVGEALDTYECSQVVRATVVDGQSQVAATIGLANMADAAGAAEVDTLLADPKGNGAFTVMNAPDVNEDLLRKGKILVDHAPHGHYVIFVTVTKLGVSTFDNSDPAIRAALTDCRKYLTGVLNERAS